MRCPSSDDDRRDDYRELTLGRRTLRSAAFRLAALLCAAGAALQPVGAQQDSGLQVPAADRSVEQESDRARRAQRSFERIRRSHFPRSPWFSDACDEQVGRFCLNHDSDDEWAAAPEHPEVTERRGWLLATLDSVARVVQGDRWLLGQRVKYRLEAGRATETLDLLADCGATEGWCLALRALTLHQERRHAEAETTYDRALAAMSPREQCAWTDASLILEPQDRRDYRRLACGSPARRAFERAFWHLSDPLWLVAGHELRVEHLSRRVRNELEADAASGYGMSWGADLEELTTRYGWPAGWDVAWRRTPGVRTERSIQAHRPPEAQRFVVSGFSRRDRESAPIWDLDAAKPRSTWSPPGGPVYGAPYQLAAFWRGEERLIVAAFDAPSELENCVARSGLFLSNSFDEIHRTEGNGTLPLQVLEPKPSGAATLVGIETRCVDGSGAARSRTALPQTGNLLSDILLLDPVEQLPGTLDAALGSARPHSTARSGEKLTVFWEWYGGAEASGALAVTLSLTREEKSLVRKALEWTGLAGQDEEEVGIRWSEQGGTAASDNPMARAVELQLPQLAPGRYRLTLQVHSVGAGTVTSPKEIVIEP